MSKENVIKSERDAVMVVKCSIMTLSIRLLTE